MEKKRRALLAALVLCASSLCSAQTPADVAAARRDYDAGQFAQAADEFRIVLTNDPNNADALAGLVDSLEAKGEWRSAVEPLARLVSLQPTDAARNSQLGRWYSWQDGRRAEALKFLRAACDLDRTAPQYCTEYADVLSWREDTRGEAVTQLRDVTTKFPKHVPALSRLAEILSWNKSTYDQAIRLFSAAVEIEPRNVPVLVAYADALGTKSASRTEAIAMYNRALAVDPKNSRAQAGKAQMLAWTGRSRDAMSLYDEALALDPKNADALRGKAEILNWRGEYSQATEYLLRAKLIAPDDQRISAELARSEMGQGHYGLAQSALSGVSQDPEYRSVHEDAFRSIAPWSELGVAIRRNRRNLDYERLIAAVSSPLGFNNRLTVRYSPSLFSTKVRDFNSNVYDAELSSRFSDRAEMRAHVGAETYPGIESEVLGGAQFRFRPTKAWEIKTGFDRTAVDESLLSLRGVDVGSVLGGQVTANLGTASLGYNNARHGVDLAVTYSDGVYTARNLDANRRWSVEGNAGKSFSGTPYFRIGYGVMFTRFAYDADTTSAPVNQQGGYFSPSKYLLNYGSATVSHKFNDRLQVEATGTAGVQNVETTTSEFANAQFASSAMAKVMYRMRASDELRFQYDFLNVYSAFRRNLYVVTWRHYF